MYVLVHVTTFIHRRLQLERVSCRFCFQDDIQLLAYEICEQIQHKAHISLLCGVLRLYGVLVCFSFLFFSSFLSGGHNGSRDRSGLSLVFGLRSLYVLYLSAIVPLCTCIYNHHFLHCKVSDCFLLLKWTKKKNLQTI